MRGFGGLAYQAALGHHSVHSLAERVHTQISPRFQGAPLQPL